jgi:penicillin-binding protein 2
MLESHVNTDPRLRFFYGVVMLLMLWLTIGLGYRQLFGQETYSEREKLQSQRRILIPGPRGDIFDREGRLLVGNRPRFSAVIYLSDRHVRSEFRREYIRVVREARDRKEPIQREGLEAQVRAGVVQRYLDDINQLAGRADTVDSAVLDRHFQRQPLLPFPLADDLTPEQFARLLEQIPVGSPLQLQCGATRYYPFGSAASHTLGYVVSSLDLPEANVPGRELTTFASRGSFGRNGLERRFDPVLQGETGGEIWIVDPAGFQVERVEFQAPVKGQDLVTSLDVDLQMVAERAFGQRRGALAALDVETGEVLALVSKPDYDLNDLTPFIPRTVFNRINEDGAWLNRAAQGLYPPGSTFKIISAIAGLRVGAFTPEAKVNCTGYYQVAGRRFPCHNRRGHGEVDLREALRASCNVYFYHFGLATGADNIAAEARRFNLHQATGVELPFETRGMLVPDTKWKRETIGESWFPGDTANFSIGQGFLRNSPLQIAAAVASFARNESVTRPTLLRRSAAEVPAAAGNAPLGLSESDRQAIIEGMERAVESGTARMTRLPNIRIAAKTGTAQVRTAQGTLELAWFVAFAPVENPTIAVALVVEGREPDEANAGGLIAAPIGRQVLERYFAKHPLP